jgi:hypothetical protein
MLKYHTVEDVRALLAFKMHFLFILSFLLSLTQARTNRQNVVTQFNPVRTASSNSTPMQVGNGDFGFGVDVTGLQTFQSFATMSSWGWHNFGLPTILVQSSVEDFNGLNW